MGRRAERQSLKKLREGQREACEKLVYQYYRSIYRFMAYLTRDINLAEELTQETFASAWANIGQYRRRASFVTWLHQIAYRKFIDSRRKLQRDAALTTRLKQERINTTETLNPLRRLTADEHTRLLHQALHSLRPSDYIVILLHYIQGLSFRQVARVLDEPVGTVKWQNSRALKKLREYLTGRV